jgi:beta-xylosidase
MTHIDIDRLSEPELIDLNRRIVERLRVLQMLRSHQQMMKFSVGQRVRFEPPGRGVVTGIVTRYNRKTVSVVTEDGGQWTVAPALLRAADLPTAQRVDEAPMAASKVVDLPLRGTKP